MKNEFSHDHHVLFKNKNTLKILVKNLTLYGETFREITHLSIEFHLFFNSKSTLENGPCLL